MSTRTNLAVALLVAMVTMGGALAQDTPEQYAAALKANCAKELKANCKGVADGRGRLLACLYSRQNKLSQKCDATVEASLERLGLMFGALANVVRVCEADARRFCNGVQPGNGHLADCLNKARNSVSEKCNAALDLAFLRP